MQNLDTLTENDADFKVTQNTFNKMWGRLSVVLGLSYFKDYACLYCYFLLFYQSTKNLTSNASIGMRKFQMRLFLLNNLHLY